MSFVHENAEEFADLIQIVVGETGMSRAVVEKDYWVKSEGSKVISERRAFFEQLAKSLSVPGCSVELEVDTADKTWHGANLRVNYLGELPQEISGNARLEVGSARVTPFIPRDITSWVYEKLVATGASTEFDDNRASGVRCVHPLVTLLEKLDALHRRFPNEKVPPQMFVRRYEDAARLIDGIAKLPPLDGYASVRALADEMLAQEQLAAMPVATDVALAPRADARWGAVRSAHAAIQPMFWGRRLSIEDATTTIRAWIAAELA